MNSKPKKRCNPQELDCRYNLDLYFSDKEDAVFREDFLKFPMKALHDVFSKGVIHGNIMIDMSMGLFIHHLYSASDVFKDIIIMKFSKNCIMEVRKRLDDQTGAYSSAYASAVGELEAKSYDTLERGSGIKGEGVYSLRRTKNLLYISTSQDFPGPNFHRVDRPQWRTFSGVGVEEICPPFGELELNCSLVQSAACDQKDKKLKLKPSIKQIVKGNLNEENLTHPLVLPLADCVMSAGLLDIMSKDEHDYMRNLGKVSKLLKPRGHLTLMGLFNNTYFTAGSDKFHSLKYDESFLRSALSKVGFVIDDSFMQKRTNVSDLADYSHVFVMSAHKEK